jgi:hypothetical protein
MAVPYYNPLITPVPSTMEYQSQNQDVSAYQERIADLEAQLAPQIRKDQKHKFKITCCAIASLVYILLCYIFSTALKEEEIVLAWIFMFLVRLLI